MTLKTSDFDFVLPEELIAQTPLSRRDGSRLLVLDRDTGAVEHRHFFNLPEYLRAGDCLVSITSYTNMTYHSPMYGGRQAPALRDN